MTSEEKVLQEIREKLNLIIVKISELKVAEEERKQFEIDKSNYQILIADYKKHKQALEDKYGKV